MSTRAGDPQVIAFLERSARFEEELAIERSNITSLRGELDGVWASRRSDDGVMSWTYYPRARAKEREARRSA